MMSYLSVCSPIDGLVKSGTYGNLINQKASYTLSHQKDVSVVKIIVYSVSDLNAVSVILKSSLGLIVPDIGKVYVSGTRKILRLDAKSLLITTEGEARGVLFERLNYNLHHYAAIYDETSALTVLRLDGYYIYAVLSSLLSDLSTMPTFLNECAVLEFDKATVICHLNAVDTVFLYLERSYAFEIYSRIARLCLPVGLKIL
jgi:hypothetical protein